MHDSCSIVCTSILLVLSPVLLKSLKLQKIYTLSNLQSLLADLPTPCHMKPCSKNFSIMKYGVNRVTLLEYSSWLKEEACLRAIAAETTVFIVLFLILRSPQVRKLLDSLSGQKRCRVDILMRASQQNDLFIRISCLPDTRCCQNCIFSSQD